MFLIASTCTCGVALLGLMAPLDPVFELATHCYMHCWIASLVLLATGLVLKARRSLLISFAALLISSWFVQPWSLWRPMSVRTDLTDEIQVLSWNLLVSNRSYSEVEKIIREVDPDVLVLVELRHGFIDELPYISENFPHQFQYPSWGGEGIGVFSKIPGTTFRLEDFDYEFQPAVISNIPGPQGKELELVALHALSPLPRYRTRIRDRQIRSVIDWSQGRGPLCVCGDFNTTPWTPAFREMVQSDFVDSRMGTGTVSYTHLTLPTICSV